MATKDNCSCGCTGPDHAPGVIRLPIAPRINHRLRFAPLAQAREQHILPLEAVRRLAEAKEAGTEIDTVLLYGPGDPLAAVEPTLETVDLIRNSFREVKIVIRTLGIGGIQHADRLAAAGVSEVELLLDGIDPGVLEKIYAWVRPGFKTLQLSESLGILLEEQARAIQAFKDAGCVVRLITTCYPTVNDDHLPVLARSMGTAGVDEMVLLPYIPEAGMDITLPEPEPGVLAQAIATLGEILPTRAGRPLTIETEESSLQTANLPKPEKNRPNVAVVSTNGMDVDLHLGQAPQILVYGPREDGLACLLECRKAPEPGSGSERWDRLAGVIPDCFALLTASAGERPREILARHNIRVIITRDNIEGTVDVLYGGGKKGKKGKRSSATM